MTNETRLYRLQVPIRNYMNDGIFEQDMFIMSSRIPNREDWRKLAMKNHIEDSMYPEYTGDWNAVLDVLINCDEFPQLASSRMLQTNTFVDTPFGKKPLTVRVQSFHEEK